jgi:hypothetical protein
MIIAFPYIVCTEAYNTVGALIDVEDSLASSNAKSQANNGLSGIRKEKKSYQETTVLQIEGGRRSKGWSVGRETSLCNGGKTRGWDFRKSR